MASPRTLQPLEFPAKQTFAVPVKRIHDGDDVSFFLSSRAYSDIIAFILQLNASMIPRKAHNAVTEWTLTDSAIPTALIVQNLGKFLDTLGAIIDEVPPDTGPRRFGNISFRKWYDIVRERIPQLLDEFLPAEILSLGTGEVTAKAELEAYLIGSFGSSQRLDYGTGHELSFLAFLGCLWKLGAFPQSQDGDQERAIVLMVIEPYLELIRRLILTYTLEPAGSHGVWGLDDHSFLPFIFGSAQYCPPISSPADIATEGSLDPSPDPADVIKRTVVDRERKRNMYFSAIGFIYDVKRGPFWEHSPILHDISGVKKGWAKINSGMMKMYNVEVLSKFPVVQHFPFGSLFVWEKDPAAPTSSSSVHTANQPQKAPGATPRQPPLRDPLGADPSQGGTRAPWASGPGTAPQGSTMAPWARKSPAAPPGAIPSGPNQPTRAPWASTTPVPPRFTAPSRAPRPHVGGSANPPSTRAPWADKGS